jgi:hypothetical protein
MWLSVDPAMGEYIPQAPINDDIRKQNQNLPGMGGVFNYVNLHVYHYAGNNPVKLVDPTGAIIIMVQFSGNAGIGSGFDANTGLFLCIPGDGGDVSLGVYTSGAGGAFFSYGVSIGVGVTVAPFADSFSDVEGFSLVAGASAPIPALLGVTLTGEIGVNPQATGPLAKLRSLTITLTGSLKSIGLPAEGHVYTVKTTKRWEINLSNLNREFDLDKVMEFINENKFKELAQYVIDIYEESVME